MIGEYYKKFFFMHCRLEEYKIISKKTCLCLTKINFYYFYYFYAIEDTEDSNFINDFYAR